MGSANAFGQGLEVTAWGMGLVFLTLIIVALVIWILDKVFRPHRHDESDGDDGIAAESAVTAAPAMADLSNEAAAIAVAMVIERSRATRVRVPSSRQPFDVVAGDEDVVGEVVTVAQFEAGTGMWKNAARLKSSI